MNDQTQAVADDSWQGDVLERFIFDQRDVRACVVQLEQSIQDNHKHHSYPKALADLLSEFMVATALLSSSLKFEGRLVLQLRSQSEVPLLMAECNHHAQVRAYAQYQELSSDFSFESLTKGTLAMTLEPEVGEPYQGIVPLMGQDLAQCLQFYFEQSEQLGSHFQLSVRNGKASGFMLQQLPPQYESEAEQRQQTWNDLKTLAETLETDELFGLNAQTIMHRLFHEFDVRFLEKAPVEFKCRCSKARMDQALVSLGQEELESILAEQGQIDMACEFCRQAYLYDQEEVRGLFETGSSPTLH